jgi:hypothetical protein
MYLTRLYGVATILNFPLYDFATGKEFVDAAAHAAGDTVLSKDEGAEASTTNGFVDEGKTYSIILTAAEMTAKRIVLTIEDQGTKIWLDTAIIIETFGHPDAMFPDAFTDISAANAAAVMTALATDAFAEPSGVPAATATLVQKIGFLYMALRNKITVTASKKIFFDDGDAAEWEKDLTDDGTTYTESEGNAP